MACTEIGNAIDWAMQTKPNDLFPVTAFVTRHQGILSKPADPLDKGLDFCSYASGRVAYVAPVGPIGVVGHLEGNLTQFENSSSASGMPQSSTTLTVKIFSDGTVIFQDFLNGKPIPSAQTVKASCVGGVLLTGSYNNGVVVVGLRREQEEKGPP